MSTDTASIEQPKAKPEALFSKKNQRLLTDPLDNDNPISVQVLGICSALAVTAKLYNSLVMAIAVIAVTAFSNLTISLLRNGIPPRIRMIVQLVVIAALVVMVDQILKAFSFPVWKELTVYIGLIITNCIIMGRLEAFAMANKPWPAFLDGVGNGLGYGALLIIVAFFRELLGSGKLLGHQVMWEGYTGNGLMLMPASAMFLIGVFIWAQRSWNKKLVDAS
jgi:Na+-transporting NADH:ubiquinone oxidoreductase subunit D